ncbi:ATP-binding protein [Amycolatopsis thailandensis]|uniref:ATP-binding protein n=1 Tax=Amycolatopsis thailandensis TaxID=589330 RepID=UPI0037BA4EE8
MLYDELAEIIANLRDLGGDHAFVPGTDRPICENRGSGIPTMLAAMRDAKLSPPRFADNISTFTATFPNHTLMGNDAVRWIGSLNEHGLSDSQCHGLAMLFHGETLNNQAYRNANDLDSRVATEELGDLVARGLLVPGGGRRYAQYTLAEDADPHSSGNPAPVKHRADRREEILAALGDGEATRADLVAATGLHDRTVTRWLSTLLRQGLIEATEKNLRSPNVRYRRTRQRTLDETGG